MSTVEASRVGARIRRLRLDRDLAQKDVAEPVLTAAYLSLIESGQRAPSQRALEHIAAKLGVEIDEVLVGKPSGLDAKLELQLQEARTAVYRGEVEAAETSLRKIIKSARKYALNRLEARAVTVTATLAERRGDLGEASLLFEKAIEIFDNAPTHLKFEAIVGHARCAAHSGDPRLAIFLLESYLVELRQQHLEEPAAKVRVLATLVNLYRTVGLNQRSIEVAEEAIMLAPHVEDPEQIACMNMNVARALLNDGRFDDAMTALARAEQIFQVLDWPLEVVRSKMNKGIVQAERGQLEAAGVTFREAMSLLLGINDERRVIADAMNELARVERLLGHHKEAKELLEDARKMLPENRVFDRAFNAREMGLLLAGTDTKAAESELSISAQMFEEAGSAPEAARSLLELGRLLSEQGDHENAAAVFRKGLELDLNPGI